jgi:hypothetical protein
MRFQRRDAENAEEAQRTRREIKMDEANEAFDLTRRRGDAEKDAENTVEKRRGTHAFL